ncbi:hypothetical protein GCM10007108_06180 [Thermogymnomonas acidicola]|uniref:Uncharacterized protein n=1 Tax=Thermogymnomonas acidicola TaxID=399579 RepID=A0AA37BQU9_9ARCH|nr:hypothetical protein GCM10007108_06180 [Thermogymnomonas acidicola]
MRHMLGGVQPRERDMDKHQGRKGSEVQVWLNPWAKRIPYIFLYPSTGYSGLTFLTHRLDLD